jgi:hypothetical protein
MAQGGEITSIKFYIYELCSFYGCGLGERIPERTRYNDEAKIFEPVLATPFRDRNLLLAEVRDCTISGPRNPAVVCFTSPLPYLIAISSPHPFCFLSTTHNLP